MFLDIIEHWLNSKQFAHIDGLALRPKEHQLLKGSPLCVSRGQATAFYLQDTTQQLWILKKFLPGRNLEREYLTAIQPLIPKNIGFESGFQRRILTSYMLLHADSHYFSSELSSWLADTILMPCVKGDDWATIAEKIRQGQFILTKEERLYLCYSLIEQVGLLERYQIAHRDLSSTNIFIDTTTWQIHFIDWDSLYHPSLKMPGNTTSGTNGYTAPLAKQDYQRTWIPYADRFSMAILILEFLAVVPGISLTNDGGIFDQDELNKRGGRGIAAIVDRLNKDFPQVHRLFGQVLLSNSFREMPSPSQWKEAISSKKSNSTDRSQELVQMLWKNRHDLFGFVQQYGSEFDEVFFQLLQNYMNYAEQSNNQYMQQMGQFFAQIEPLLRKRKETDMSTFASLFSSLNFTNTIQKYANQNGWKIAELDNKHARLGFNMESGRTQTVYIIRYESTLEFSVPSAIKFDSTDDVPHYLSTLLLKRNTEKKIGFWCLEEIRGNQIYSFMHNAELELINSDYFGKVIRALINECDDFEGTMIEMLRNR